MGYSRAGFDVVGIDVEHQPRYPFRFIQADALEYLAANGRRFDAVHASPPCQCYTSLRSLCAGKTYPDLVGPTRDLLQTCGRPYVIENVPGAPLARSSLVLCGGMFGLRVYRHRLFESPFFVPSPPHPPHAVRAGAPGTKGGTGRKAHYMAGGNVTVCGDIGVYAGPAMGITWMNGGELSQAIPPAYTEHVGLHLMRHLR